MDTNEHEWDPKGSLVGRNVLVPGAKLTGDTHVLSCLSLMVNSLSAVSDVNLSLRNVLENRVGMLSLD